MNMTRICKLSEWTKLDKKRVLALVRRNTLNIAEAELFEAIHEWAKAESKRHGTDHTPESLRNALDNILNEIRFPCMQMDEIATRVTPTQLLKADVLLQIYTYLGSNPEKQRSMRMNFPIKPRTPRRPPSWFSWSQSMRHNSVVLQDKNMVITSYDFNNWQSVAAEVELKKGVHEWELVLEQYDTANSYNVIIGVVPTHLNIPSFTNFIGAQSTSGWGFCTGNGYKSSANTSQTSYGTACKTGDVIRVRLDLDKRTIEFFQNGRNLGVAFTDVSGPVRPAVSLIRSQRILLRFPRG